MDWQDGQTRHVFQSLQQTADGRQTSWVTLHRGFDETQMSLSYGPCSEQLRKWTLDRIRQNMNYQEDEREQLCALASRMPYGTCSVLVSSATLRWGRSESPGGFGCSGVPSLWECPGSPGGAGGPGGPGGYLKLLPPLCALQRNTAACIRAGLDCSLPCVSFDMLEQLAASVRVVIVGLVRDSASANLLLTRQLGDLPDNVLVWAWSCDLHLLFRGLAALLADLGLLSPLFGLTKLLRLTDNYSRFVRSVSMFVSRHLDIILDVAPLAAWESYNRTVLKYTLRRQLELTDARRHPNAPQPRARPRTDYLALEECEHKLLAALNGHWASPLRHYCNDASCPHHRKVTQSLLQCIERLFPSLPAENKWTSVQSSRAFVSFLFLVCRSSSAFVEERDGADMGDLDQDEDPEIQGPGELLDFQVVNRRRMRKSKEFLSSYEKLFECSLLNVIAHPVDSCLQFLDYADNSEVFAASPECPGRPGGPGGPGGSPRLLQLMCEPNGPVVSMQRELAALLLSGSDLQRMLTAYANCEPEETRPMWSVLWGCRSLGLLLNVAGATYWQVECRYRLQPQTKVFKTFWSTDPQKVAQETLAVPECCRDEFLRRLCMVCNSPKELLEGPVREALAALYAGLNLTSANLERMHAGNRQIARPSNRAPISAERLRHESLLQAAMRDHVQAGHPDLSKLNRAALKEHGLLTVASRAKLQKRRRLPVASNAALLFGNHWKRARAARGAGRLSPQELSRRARMEWSLLPEVEKRRWKAKWHTAVIAAREARSDAAGGVRGSGGPDSPGVSRVCWPVPLETLTTYLSKVGRRDVSKTGAPGPRNAGRLALQHDAFRLLVPEPPVRPAPPMRHECWKVHPGICKAALGNEAALQKALLIAANLRKCFGRLPRNKAAGQFLKIDASSSTQPPHQRHLCLCEFRRARPAVLVFAECCCLQSDQELELALEDGRLQFVLNFEVAQSLLPMDSVDVTFFKVLAESELLLLFLLCNVSLMFPCRDSVARCTETSPFTVLVLIHLA